MLILGRANTSTITLSALGFLSSTQAGYGQMAVAINVGTVLLLILALFARRYRVRGLTLDAVKG